MMVRSVWTGSASRAGSVYRGNLGNPWINPATESDVRSRIRDLPPTSSADRSLLQGTGIWRDVYGVLLQRRERNDLQRALVSRCQDHRRRSAVEMSS
jgi:hypothetical protein